MVIRLSVCIRCGRSDEGNTHDIHRNLPRWHCRDLPAADWEPYLLAHSNLPGPRGNLELASTAADVGTEAQFRRWAGLGPDVAPENTPGCFLAFCGVVGLGAIMARGRVGARSSPRPPISRQP